MATQAIENRFIKILNTNPNLINTFPSIQKPLFKNITLKYWSHIINSDVGGKNIAIDYNWMDKEPQTPSSEILDVIRFH